MSVFFCLYNGHLLYHWQKEKFVYSQIKSCLGVFHQLALNSDVAQIPEILLLWLLALSSCYMILKGTYQLIRNKSFLWPWYNPLSPVPKTTQDFS